VVVLDTRQYRSDQPAGDGTFADTPASMDPNTSLTGPEQERWLLEQLDASSSTWNVIAQQVMMAEAGVVLAEGGVETHPTDMWSGYPAARKRILSHFAESSIANPVVLTGDIHSSWANDLRVDFEEVTEAPVATEYVCTSITAGGTHPADYGAPLAASYPHFKFADPRHGGYAAATLTKDLWTTDFILVDDMENVKSGVSNIGTFVTEAGSPGTKKA
jgi:alkaline phosphatase D